MQPRVARLHIDLSDCLAAEGQWDAAFAAVRTAIMIEPDSAAWHVWLGELLLRANRLDQAEPVLRQAILRWPDIARAHFLLSIVLERNERMVGATSAIWQAVLREPNYANWWHHLGEVLQHGYEFDAAEQAYRRAAELDPAAKVTQERLAALSGLHAGARRVAAAPAAFASYRKTTAAEFAVPVATLFPGVDISLPNSLVYSNLREIDWPGGNIYSGTCMSQATTGSTTLFCSVFRRTPRWSCTAARTRCPCTRIEWQRSKYLQTGRTSNCSVPSRNAALSVRWIGTLSLSSVTDFAPTAIGQSNCFPRSWQRRRHFPAATRYAVPDHMINDPVLRSMRELLEFFGIFPDRLVYLQAGHRYRFRELLTVSPVWTNLKAHPAVVEMMRAEIMRRFPDSGPSRRVALLRRNLKTRNLSNLDEIQQFLLANGWEIIDVGHLPFAEEVALYANAAAVLSIQGSTQSNLIYAPMHVKVISLTPIAWGDANPFGLTQNRHGSFADVRGMPDERDHRPLSIRGFRVNTDDIAASMRAMGL